MSGLAGKVGAIFQKYTGTDKHKLIADFQDDENWISGAGTQTDDDTNYRLGIESLKIAEDDNSAGLLYSELNSISLNLATFTSGAVSDTSDYIYLICYISNVAKVTNIKVHFSTEATYDGDPSYTYTISTGLVDGWNYIKIKKSAFTNVNMSDWTGIQSIRIGWTSTTTASGSYVSFQAIYLVDDSYDLILSNNTAYIVEQKGLCTNWSLDTSCDMAEDTELGSEWKTFVPILGSFTVAIEKFWQSEENLTNLGTEQAILLYTNTVNGYRYEGIGNIDSDSISTTVNELITESVNFNGKGTLYYTSLLIKTT